jgi:voltage-gated potassium channel
METTLEVEPLPGTPRSPEDAAYLERFDRVMRLPIIISAILPLVVVPESSGWVGIVVGVVTWLVFLVDYVTHARRIHHYRRTRYGRLDLFVVIATAPWFLLPGAQPGRFVVIFRLARLARVVMATKGSRRLFERLGRVAAVAAGVVFFGSAVAYYAEHPTNPEFATFGDALWWGIVTLTTVGYGDIVPKTSTGRWAGVMIMITGIAVLGLLSGSLASFFRLGPHAEAAEEAADGQESGEVSDSTDATPSEPGTTASPDVATALAALTEEVSSLRRQVELLADPSGGAPPGGTAPGAGPT